MSARRANLLSDQCRPTPELRGAGGRNQGKTGQSVTPRPLERRVGRRTRKEWPLLFALGIFPSGSICGRLPVYPGPNN